jgi:hypothetical protein
VNARSIDLNGFTRDPDKGWYVRVVSLSGAPVAIRIGGAPRVAQATVPHARALLDDLEGLERRFIEFQQSEAHRRPGDAAQIEKLQIDAIDFFNYRRPSVGEVSFTQASAGESWTCLIDDGRFKDLISGA